MWATPEACAAARAAATAAGAVTSRAARPATKRRRISSAAPSSPRENARARATASRGRSSPGASDSNRLSTRSAQSAAHIATTRRSASLRVCEETTPAPSHRMGRAGIKMDEMCKACFTNCMSQASFTFRYVIRSDYERWIWLGQRDGLITYLGTHLASLSKAQHRGSES